MHLLIGKGEVTEYVKKLNVSEAGVGCRVDVTWPLRRCIGTKIKKKIPPFVGRVFLCSQQS